MTSNFLVLSQLASSVSSEFNYSCTIVERLIIFNSFLKKCVLPQRLTSRLQWTNKILDDWNPTPAKSCLMVGTPKIVKTFSKILLSSALFREPKFKKILFLEKSACFTAPFFICNYMTVMQYTIGKNSLIGKEWHIICQNIFLFGKVITF